MAGDYTQFTHKLQKRYSAVLMQQGRVQLDADPNELAEITKRRWEVQARDVFGDCAVPGATTPDAFEISLAPNPPLDLLLGVGRMYVDGLLAEIFEGESFSYLKQPFLPTPPDLASVASPSSVAFLDVWEREVTYIEDRDLLEIALSGPDTTTRLQTVWQVKVTEGDCATDFDALFPPSAGRLSSRAVQPPASDDECILAPTGGYRGLENRLYRVEIHLPGAAGDLTAIRFKWSRENASIVSSVEAIAAAGNQSQVTVTRIGRDKILRFKINDWIEVLDDHRELMEQPGAMARIVGIDEANRRLTLDRLLPADFDPADAGRHTRMIRWDQKKDEDVDADGLMTGSPDWILLEDGVEIRLALEPASGACHVRDYWAFAARTADGSVEVLDEAPPRAIVHHYCALATLTGLSAGNKEVQDCRHICTPCAGDTTQPDDEEAACCVIVQPGGSIQAAIDALPPSGGCVCLKTGTHSIDAAISIHSSNVVLHGESLGARIVRGNGLPLLSITGAVNVAIHDLRFELTGSGSGQSTEIAIVSLDECKDVTIERCEMVAGTAAGAVPVPLPAAAVIVQHSASIHIRENEMRSVMIGVWGPNGEFVHVTDNRIIAPPVSGLSGTLSGLWGVFVGDGAQGPWHVAGNTIENFATGIAIGAEAERSRVALNLIERFGNVPPVDPAVEPLDPLVLLTGGNVKPLDLGRAYAIDVSAEHCQIQENAITLTEPRQGGIRGTGRHVRVEGNVITSQSAAGPLKTPPLAILVGPHAGGSPPDGCIVKGNTIVGFQDGILATGTDAMELQRIHVVANQIQPLAAAKPRLAIGLKNTDSALVGENRIAGAATGVLLSDGRNNRVVGNQVRDGGFGLFAGGDIGETAVELSGNVIENMSGAGIAGERLLELAVVTHNRLTWCGHAAVIGAVVKAALRLSCVGHVRVESCEIRDAGLPPTGAKASGAVHGIRISARSCHVGSNRTMYSDFTLLKPTAAHRALLVEAAVVASGGSVASDNATIVDNAFAGSGLPHLVEIRRFPQMIARRFRNVIFSNNRCDHRGTVPPSQSGPATVSLWAQHLSVAGNHVESQTPAFPSVTFNGLKNVALVANVTTGVFVNLGGSLPQPPALFNVKL